MENITSRANPLLTHMKKLAADGGYRRQCGEFLCDSPKLLQEALAFRAPITAVVSTTGVTVEGARCAAVPEDVMASVSPMKTPQGVMFTVKMPSLTPPSRVENPWRRNGMASSAGKA